MKKILLALNVLAIVICFFWTLVAIIRLDKFAWFPLVLMLMLALYGILLPE